MKKFLPVLLSAMALMSAAGSAQAQLVVGNDSSTGQLWVVDVLNGGAGTRQLVSGTQAQVRGVAADNVNGILYWLDGSSNPQTLYKATMVPTGTLTPVSIGTVRIGATNTAVHSLAYDQVANKLYCYNNSASTTTEGFYEVNTTDATLTAVFIPGVTGGEATGLDYNADNDSFYYTCDSTTVTALSPNGRGVYRLQKPLTAPTVTLVTTYPGTDVDIDGLAVGNGRVYLVNDALTQNHFVYNLTTNSFETDIVPTFSTGGGDSGGAWAPALVTVPTSGANVTLIVTDSPDPLAIPPGGAITYTLTATNFGPDTATGVVLTGTIPSNTTFTSITAPGVHNAGTITANFGTLASGASSSVTLVVQGPGAAPDTVSFTSSVSTTSTDPVPTDNSFTATTNVVEASANLSLVVTDSPATLIIPPGGQIVFTATVNNTVAGNTAAQDVVVTATLPPEYTFVSATNGATFDGVSTVTANLGAVAFGTSPNFQVTVNGPASVSGTTTVTFPFSLSSSTPDPVLTNNVDNETTTIREQQAALAITNVDSPDPIVIPPGGNINYLITVTNSQSATTDPNGAENVTVTGTLPPEVTFVSIDAPGTYDPGSRTISINLGTVFNGSPASFNVQVTADTIGSALFPVTVTTTTFEPTTTNNSATATTTIRGPQANIGVAIIDPSDCSINAGDNFSYTVNVTNAGPEIGEGITLAFTLPNAADATFVSSSPSLTPVGDVLTLNVGTLNSGESASLTVNMTALTAGATLSSSASVTSTSQDPTPANDTASQTTLINNTGGPTTAAIKGVFSTIAASTSSDVPGLPGTKFAGLILNRPFASPDGTKFIVSADTDLATTEDGVIVVSSGGTLSVVAREGQPIAGITPTLAVNQVDGTTGFDFAAGINNAGNYAFSGNFTGSASDDFVVKNVGGVFSLVVEEDATSSATVAAGSTTFNDINGGVTILPDNTVSFLATLNGPPTTSDTALVRNDGNTLMIQEGITQPTGLAGGAANWSGISATDALTLEFDATGTNWTLAGDTDAATTIDNIAVLTNQVVLQEGETLAGASGPTSAAIGRIRIAPNGDWLSTFTGGSVVHIVRNGTILLRTGDPVPGGNGETFNRTAFEIAGNANGDYVYGVETTEPDVLRDAVLVLNNTTVIARQNDPIDLDNNGVFDDNAYLRAFENDNIFMTNDAVYVTVTIRNSGAALCGASDTTAVGAALIRIPITPTVVFPARCNGADIAYDNGDFLPRAEIVDGTNGTPAIPGPFGGTNNGVTEADYNVFFANFFDAFSVADIANDDGTTRVPTPAPGTVVNNGVTEGDYNYFFSVFFDGCSL